MAMGVTNSRYYSMDYMRSIDGLVTAPFRRKEIANVFENAKYNKQGFAEATHDAVRIFDNLGKTQKIAFVTKIQPKSFISKLGGYLKNLVKIL